MYGATRRKTARTFKRVRAVCSAGRTYYRQESIEVRPLFQRDYLASQFSKDVLAIHDFCFRLLSELICHKNFQRFMLDAEIYVDRIADMRINDMNAVLEAVRQMALMKNGGEENDLHLRTLEVAQIREDEYFGGLIADALKGILRDIRSEHHPDTMTADETSLAATVQEQLQDAMGFEGSSEEKNSSVSCNNRA